MELLLSGKGLMVTSRALLSLFPALTCTDFSLFGCLSSKARRLPPEPFCKEDRTWEAKCPRVTRAWWAGAQPGPPSSKCSSCSHPREASISAGSPHCSPCLLECFCLSNWSLPVRDLWHASMVVMSGTCPYANLPKHSQCCLPPSTLRTDIWRIPPLLSPLLRNLLEGEPACPRLAGDLQIPSCP